MRKSRVIGSIVISFCTLLAMSSSARADDKVDPNGIAWEKDHTAGNNHDDDLKHFTLTANPLSLILGRIGVNFEYLPVKHHALVVNPYVSFSSASDDNEKITYTTLGGELGYHFYAADTGANGLFLGPSFLFSRSTLAASVTNGSGAHGDFSNSFTSYGAAFDIGGQHITSGGFTIGAGVGVMYLVSSMPVTGSTTVQFSGLAPRILLTAGYSF